MLTLNGNVVKYPRYNWWKYLCFYIGLETTDNTIKISKSGLTSGQIYPWANSQITDDELPTQERPLLIADEGYLKF